MTKRSRPRKADSSPSRGRESIGLTDCEQHRENLLDDALADSFPASDPPSITRPPRKGC